MTKNKIKIAICALMGAVLAVLVGFITMPRLTASAAVAGYDKSNLEGVTLTGDTTVRAQYRSTNNIFDAAQCFATEDRLAGYEARGQSISLSPNTEATKRAPIYVAVRVEVRPNTQYFIGYYYRCENSSGESMENVRFLNGGEPLPEEPEASIIAYPHSEKFFGEFGGEGEERRQVVQTDSSGYVWLFFGVSYLIAPQVGTVLHYENIVVKELDDTQQAYTLTFKYYLGKNFEEVATERTVLVLEGDSTEPYYFTPSDTYRKHFMRWDSDYSNMFRDTVVTAEYVPREYSVTFTYINGTAEKTETRYAHYEDIIVSGAPNANVAIGKTFLEWQTVDGTAVSDTDIVTGDLELIAVYRMNSFTVTYKYLTAAGVETSEDVVVEYGAAASSKAPALPSVPGKRFTGWKLESGAEPPATVTSTLTVVAQYENISYAVVFKYIDAQGAEQESTVMFFYNQALSSKAPSLATFVDKHFVAWVFLDGTAAPSAVTSEMTVMAKYEINVYTVTFVYLDANGVEKREVKEVPYGTRLIDILPDVPAVAGKIFEGWNVDENATVTANVSYMLVIDDNGVVTPVEREEGKFNLFDWINALGSPWAQLIYTGACAAILIIVVMIVRAFIPKRRR